MQISDAGDPETKEEESPLLGAVRGKCITQLLLLGAIDSIQVKINLLKFFCWSIQFFETLKYLESRLRLTLLPPTKCYSICRGNIGRS